MLLSVCVRKCKKRDIYKEIMLQGCSCSVAENNNKNNNNSVGDMPWWMADGLVGPY